MTILGSLAETVQALPQVAPRLQAERRNKVVVVTSEQMAEAAELGHAQAQLCVAREYLQNLHSVFQPSQTLAIHWLEACFRTRRGGGCKGA
jgi:hypothetical protein